jgi:hypothetical protein
MKEIPTTEFTKHWKTIYNGFNWGNVYKAMKALDWTWAFPNDNEGIPNLNTIQTHAHYLLLQAWKEKKTISTGGFRASYDNGHIALEFVLEDWHSGDASDF